MYMLNSGYQHVPYLITSLKTQLASSRFTVCKEYLIHSILIFTKVLEGLTLHINSIYGKQKHRFSEKSDISQSYIEIILKPE